MHHFEIHIRPTDALSADLNYAPFASKRLSRHATESMCQPENDNSEPLDHNIIKNLLQRHHTAAPTMQDRLSAATRCANGITRSCKTENPRSKNWGSYSPSNLSITMTWKAMKP